MSAVQHARLQVQLSRVFDDGNLVQRVARVLVKVLARIHIRLSVEIDTLLVAQREQRVDRYQLLHRQVQAVIDLVAVVAYARELVVARLTVRHAVPRDRCGRTDDSRRVDRINMINDQLQS